MSRVDEIFANLGNDKPAPTVGNTYKLFAKDLIKELSKMPEASAITSQEGPNAIKEVLWTTVSHLVKRYAFAPDGKTLLEVHE